MADHPQAKKRNRQRIKRTARNRHVRSTMRSSVRVVRALVDKGETDAAMEELKVAIKLLDKAANKGVMHHRTASRTISRLTVAVNKIASTA
ncbi:MAG: 30S ribosomal protein S20 [Proteobacteria bacterium]|nr:30S ribosomal protein S20 [Pseudomonadota bacterium]